MTGIKMSSESEQGESTREAPLPCLTELLSCTGMEPKSQIDKLKQVTNSALICRGPWAARQIGVVCKIKRRIHNATEHSDNA